MKQLSKPKNSIHPQHSASEDKQFNKKIKKMHKNNKKLDKFHRPNSLDFITKEAISYLIESNKDYININNIVKAKKIPKRRIYDVINVLQGKNLI